jgi:hypothetical protein
MDQYQIVELTKDLNPAFKQGMRGVILEILDEDTFLVEFVNEDGTNLEYEGNASFDLKASEIKAVS